MTAAFSSDSVFAQKSAILAIFRKHSDPKGSCFCKRAKLAMAIAIGGMKPLPMGDESGNIHIDDVLAWLFEDPSTWLFDGPSSLKTLSSIALEHRAYTLLSLPDSCALAATLHTVWPNGHPPLAGLVRLGTDASEDALWQQCLINLGSMLAPTTVTAEHFLKIRACGWDANAVVFPAQASRPRPRPDLKGHPKPVPSLKPLSELAARDDGNNFVFPALHSREALRTRATCVDDEAGQMWLAGLAQNPFELRDRMHCSCTSFDTQLAPRPKQDVIEENVGTYFNQQTFRTALDLELGFKQDECAIDFNFFEEHHYLRGSVHSDPREFRTEMQPWSQIWVMMAEDTIPRDLCTVVQLEVDQQREKRGPLSMGQLRTRRAELQKKLSRHSGMSGKFSKSEIVDCQAETNPRFFKEIMPVLEKDAAIAEVQARRAIEQFDRARKHDEAAEFGSKFVAWPIPGTRQWPPQPAAWIQHVQCFAKRRAEQGAKPFESLEFAKGRMQARTNRDDAYTAAWPRLVSMPVIPRFSECHASSKSGGLDFAQRNTSISTRASSDADWEVLTDWSESSWEIGSPECCSFDVWSEFEQVEEPDIAEDLIEEVGSECEPVEETDIVEDLDLIECLMEAARDNAEHQRWLPRNEQTKQDSGKHSKETGNLLLHSAGGKLAIAYQRVYWDEL